MRGIYVMGEREDIVGHNWKKEDKENRVRIKHVQIQHILGISDIEFSPGAVTVLSGANNVGKSSVLKAIEAAIGVGEDAMLLKKGETEGKVVLLLDDGVVVTKTVKEGQKPKLTVKHPQFGAISQPQTYIDRLADALSVRPIDFLRAAPAKRAEYLLETLPITVSDAQLRDAGVDGEIGAVIPPETANGLDRIDSAAKLLYDERTGVNRTAKEKRATISQLEGTLEGAPEKDPRDEEQKASAESERLRQKLAVETEKIFEKERDLRAEAKEAHGTNLDRLRSDRDALIAAANASFEKKKAESLEILEKDRERFSKTATDGREKLEQSLVPLIEAASSAASESKAKAERFFADKRTREFISEHTEAAKALEDRSKELTESLKKLETLRQSSLEKLPIKGLEVREGIIYFGGIPLDQISTSSQVNIACQIATLRAGKLGIITLDGLESLDAETFAAFETWAATCGKQLVVSRVTSGPLTVTT